MELFLAEEGGIHKRREWMTRCNTVQPSEEGLGVSDEGLGLKVG